MAEIAATSDRAVFVAIDGNSTGTLKSNASTMN
jgi:hypothetical protein